MDNLQTGGKQCAHCREVVHSSECPLSEVPLYTVMITLWMKSDHHLSLVVFWSECPHVPDIHRIHHSEEI